MSESKSTEGRERAGKPCKRCKAESATRGINCDRCHGSGVEPAFPDAEGEQHPPIYQRILDDLRAERDQLRRELEEAAETAEGRESHLNAMVRLWHDRAEALQAALERAWQELEFNSVLKRGSDRAQAVLEPFLANSREKPSDG